MKKTYTFNATNKTPERQADSIKHEIKKYMARERKKDLPSGVDFWDFDCKIGDNEKVAATIHPAEISGAITKIVAAKNESFYLEIVAKPAKRTKKQTP